MSETWSMKDTPEKLATVRGIIELAVAGFGLLGLFVPFLSWGHTLYLFGIPYLNSLFSMFIIIIYILIGLCGVMSFYRPYEDIWLNVVLGALFVASLVHWFISLFRFPGINVRVVAHVITHVPGLIFALIVNVIAASAMILLTLLIRRDIPEVQTQQAVQWK